MIESFEFENVRRLKYILDLPVQFGPETLRPSHSVYNERDNFDDPWVVGWRGAGKLEVLFVGLDQGLYCV